MIYTVTENVQLTHKSWRMTLEGDTSAFSRPGQFVDIAIDGCFLRRPISVSRYGEGFFQIVYDVVGKGTRLLSQMPPGTLLDILAPLGNGFETDVYAMTYRPILYGGGIGVAPLPGLAEELQKKGYEPVAALGFNTAADVVLADDLRSLGVETFVATLDGSCGTKGFAIDALTAGGFSTDYFYACGPLPMLRSLCLIHECRGQVSLEARMACGFGACMCCTVETAKGAKRVCKDGPVFFKDELIWK